MRVLVIGATGCIGSAVAQALRARGHSVVAAARSLPDSERSMHVDYMQPCTPATWAQRLRAARIDVVVNAVGILMPSRTQSFERVHAQGPIEMFRGAAQAGVKRVVQVSALGVHEGALHVPYLATKLRADDALAALATAADNMGTNDAHADEARCQGMDHAIVRPSLVHGPGSDSAALFATLASLPVIGLPGRGQQAVQPIHVYEVAEAIVRLIEQPGRLSAPPEPPEPPEPREPTEQPEHPHRLTPGNPARAQQVYELAGPQPLTYRDMLATYRRALGHGSAVWLPTPMLLMAVTARMAEWLPQRVFSRDTLRLLEHGNVARQNAAPQLLQRAPTDLAEGLRVTPPMPLVNLRAELSPALAWLLRGSIALLWLLTAAITALWPQASGVVTLLARCGFDGPSATVVMVASCLLNTGLGVAMLMRPGPLTYSVQIGAVLGYTLTAAINMPELALDHCGPLLKNLPLLAMRIVLACSSTPQAQGQTQGRGRKRAPQARHVHPHTPTRTWRAGAQGLA